MTTTPRERLGSAVLYLCTDARRERGDLLDFAAAALDGGVDMIQLRDKGSEGERRFGPLEAAEEVRLVNRLRELAHARGALMAVNDRADIARAAHADVLHLGQDDLPVPYARDIVGADVVIGRSTHSTEQAVAAATEPGVDYFCTGPCWPTPTKPGRDAPGLDLVRATAAANPQRPWFAIGGIDGERLPDVQAAGAERIVVVRAITGATDPAQAAHDLRSALHRAGPRG
ncbi:thiamine phosphate synthase [Tsukamurella sp. 8F]|uniref:thiamine phosphate synthase n=1 Tax=unclassified Tsukamurella TaxID=2633480 RepID=UPI0023B9CE92|nr:MULTISPECIES: thiamine phosphate synthase [unclassified Tsukamurella]MDF0529531.1 thiamine phosphate synthase [Tsukamurella sp. 8J]MDF0585781.1 thiamine phosphate synthase [Tsukamurella sp. 8F]